MLIGNNELRLNLATMCAALEEYLNNRITATEDYLEVTTVGELSSTPGMFRVLVQPAKEKK